MKVGTKSVLFGAHCFLLHPIFLFIAWWKLYGFPFDLRLWVAFIVHDLGYWGKPNMDGYEGETHVELGAKIMHFLFDGWDYKNKYYIDHGIEDELVPYINKMFANNWIVYRRTQSGIKVVIRYRKKSTRWSDFCKYHSRFYAKKDGVQYSKLCVADKLAIYLTPTWLYIPMANWSGEIHEYMKLAKTREASGEKLNKSESEKLQSNNQKDWFNGVKDYMFRWVEEHRDLKDDIWTPKTKEAVNVNGVWK